MNDELLEQSRREIHGCMMILGGIAISIGIGCLIGSGWGWMTFGALSILAASVSPKMREAK